MNTYYTKCGRTFEKSTKADTTGYHITEENGAIADQECAECPFPIEVKDGWGDTATHKRWECRAGSLPPNRENTYQGRADDKCTLQISSIDHDFCEAVIAYAQGHPDLGANYTQDRADCRRVVSVSCSQNKKGMAAKQELLDKFFPEEAAMMPQEEEGPTCATCYHAAADGRICIAGEIEKRIRPTDPACNHYIGTVVDTEFPLISDLEDIDEDDERDREETFDDSEANDFETPIDGSVTGNEMTLLYVNARGAGYISLCRWILPQIRKLTSKLTLWSIALVRMPRYGRKKTNSVMSARTLKKV